MPPAGQPRQRTSRGRRPGRRRSPLPTATSPSSSSADCAASPPGSASTRKNRTSGSASPSLSPDSRLSVWRTSAGTRRIVTTRRRDDRVGRRQHRAEQEALRPAELGKQELGEDGQQRHGHRHRDDQRARRRPPVPAEQLALDQQPVGEQRQDQRELDRVPHDRRVAVDSHDVAWRQAPSRPRRQAPRRSARSPAASPTGRRPRPAAPPSSSRRLGKPEAHCKPCVTTVTPWSGGGRLVSECT